jgi:hypothetical protein
MTSFYAGSSNFIPCFDPSQDTWDSLRARSPFSITSIIMVGARVRDGGGPISDTQRLCREHAQRIAVGTLFNPVARIEAVQAMSEPKSSMPCHVNQLIPVQSCLQPSVRTDGCRAGMPCGWRLTWGSIGLS